MFIDKNLVSHFNLFLSSNLVSFHCDVFFAIHIRIKYLTIGLVKYFYEHETEVTIIARNFQIKSISSVNNCFLLFLKFVKKNVVSHLFHIKLNLSLNYVV